MKFLLSIKITAEILNKVMRVLHSLVQMLMHTFNCMVVNSIQTMASHVENCHKYHIIQNPFQDDILAAKNELEAYLEIFLIIGSKIFKKDLLILR